MMPVVRKPGMFAMVTLSLTLAVCTATTAPAAPTPPSQSVSRAASAAVAKAKLAAGRALAAARAAAVASSLVPWVNEPATAAMLSALQPKALPPPRPKTGAPPCAGAELSVARVAPIGAMQDDGMVIVFRNNGSQACTLAGRPRVVATAPGEAPVVAAAGKMPFDAEVADTPPGGLVVDQVDVPGICPTDPGGGDRSDPAYRTLVISLPRSPGRKVAVDGLRFPCGMSSTPFFTLKAQPTYAPDPLVSLVPRLVLPVSVKSGTTLGYEVELSNPGDRAVALSPCPVYIESSDVPTKLEYRLNCALVHSIPARSVVRYAMEMAIPRSAEGGRARLFWALVDFSVPVGHGQVQVSPSGKDPS
jgi:hypothetical protein